jgi:hypothetical protein
MALLWSLLLGILIISTGLGAVFPSINKIAGPFVCAGSSLQEQSKKFHPQPGKKVTPITWCCVDEKEADQQNIDSWAVSIVAGTKYGLIILFPHYYLVIWRRRKT